MEHLQAFIGDCDRRTEAAKQRLAETQEELSAEVAVKANSVHELAEQIGQKLAKAEQLGEEGFVEESMKLMEEVTYLSQFPYHPLDVSITNAGRRAPQEEARSGTGVPQLDAGEQLPATEAARLRGVLGVFGHTRQRSPPCGSLRWQAAPRLHQDQGEVGRAREDGREEEGGAAVGAARSRQGQQGGQVQGEASRTLRRW